MISINASIVSNYMIGEVYCPVTDHPPDNLPNICHPDNKFRALETEN